MNKAVEQVEKLLGILPTFNWRRKKGGTLETESDFYIGRVSHTQPRFLDDPKILWLWSAVPRGGGAIKFGEPQKKKRVARQLCETFITEQLKRGHW